MRETTDTVRDGAAASPATPPASRIAGGPYRHRMLRRGVLVLAVTIAVLAVLGPFGTFRDMTLGQRLAYWGGLILCGTLIFEGAVRIGRRLIRNHGRAWPAMLAGVLLTVSVAQTLLVTLLMDHGLGTPSASSLAERFAYVVVITVMVSGLPIWLELRGQGLVGTPPAAPPAPEPAAITEPAVAAPVPAPASIPGGLPAPPFLDRIPARLGHTLLALEMEDHYIRVHTAAGSDLILMRLRDAIAELSGLDGLQVHRSYWVAAAAVIGVERKPDGKMMLVLANGLHVPVSRSYAAEVRGAGWAERAKV